MRRSRVLMATRAFLIGDPPPLDIPDRYSVAYDTFATTLSAQGGILYGQCLENFSLRHPIMWTIFNAARRHFKTFIQASKFSPSTPRS